jgi:hypothetical protein
MLLFATLALLAAPACAADGAVDVDIVFPDRTAVLYWRNPQTYAGQMLDVYRNGERVGRIMVTEVTAYYVKGKIVEGTALVGDVTSAPQGGVAPPVGGARVQHGNPPPDGVARGAPITSPDDEERLVKKRPEDEEVVLRPQKKPAGPKNDTTPIVDLNRDAAVDHEPESVAPAKKGAKPGFLPEISPRVVYGIGGGMYNPSGDYLNGEAATLSIGSFYKIANKYEGSLSYSVITPPYEKSGTYNNVALTQEVRMTRLHLSLARLPRGGPLPSLAFGAGYTFTFFDYEICGASCARATGTAHGPHILARTHLRAPFNLIAEARYQWDLATDLDGLDTDGFEVSFLFPFEL